MDSGADEEWGLNYPNKCVHKTERELSRTSGRATSLKNLKTGYKPPSIFNLSDAFPDFVDFDAAAFVEAEQSVENFRRGDVDGSEAFI